MRTSLLLFFFAAATSLFAQKEATNWYFGEGAGISFRNGAPEVLLDGMTATFEGTGVISDKNTGELLFYTDGMTVWNRNHRVMDNGTDLYGGFSSTQSALVIPHPSNKNIYYIFCAGSLTGPLPPVLHPGLWYSVVDLSRRNGLGAVTAKNIQLHTETGEKISAARHCNGRDIWIMSQHKTEGTFYAFLLTASGISSEPVVSPAPPCTDTMCYLAGWLKISPDGKKLASAMLRGVVVAEFDNATGRVSRPLWLEINNIRKNTSYGLSFSPDNSKLYTIRTVITQTTPTYLVDMRLVQFSVDQHDLGAILASEAELFTKTSWPFLEPVAWPGFVGPFAMAPDGKIYFIANPGHSIDSLSAINYPNRPGRACDVQENALSLGGRRTDWSLPNFPDYFFHQYEPPVTFDTLYDASVCEGSPLVFPDTNAAASTWWQWSFPGGTPSSFEGRTPPPVYYDKAGTYTAQLLADRGCVVDTIRWDVVVHPRPQAIAAGNTTVCAGNATQLFASGGTGYVWSPAEGLNRTDIADPIASPFTTTTYTVTVTNDFGCTSTATIMVEVQNAPIVTVRKDTTICPGEPVQLSASGGTSYVWSPAEGLDRTDIPNPVATPSITTRYTVVVTNETGCTSEGMVLITVVDKLDVTAEAPAPICAGGSVMLSAAGADSYRWEPADGLDNPDIATPTASPLQTTTYTVTGTRGGCSGSTTVTVTVLPLPVVAAGPDTAICIGSGVQLSASGAEVYHWSPAEGLSRTDISDPFATPDRSTLYTVRGIDKNGCESEAEVYVEVLAKKKLLIQIGEFSAVPGQKISIPLVAGTENGAPLDISTLTIEMRLDADMLEILQTTAGKVQRSNDGKEYVLTIRLDNQTIRHGQILAELECRVLLNMPQEAALVCTVSEFDKCLQVDMANGKFQTGDICADTIRQIRYGGVPSVAVHPSPANEEAQVHLRDINEHASVQLYDLYGHILLQQDVLPGTKSVVLNTASYSSGVYLLKVLCSGRIFTSVLSISR